MFLFGKAKRTVHIVIEDYVIRMIENNGRDLASIRVCVEKHIPKGIIDKGKLIDEPAFYDLIKSLVQENGLKGRNVRFFVPQSLIILREIEIPEDVQQDHIKQYINLEIGNTIHFPFKHPIFDIYTKEAKENKVTILAAPEDELLKYIQMFSDVSLKPTIVEIQPLGIYRYFLNSQYHEFEANIFMIIEYNLFSVNISVFRNHKVEFLRHQPLTLAENHWKYNEETSEYVFTGDELNYQGELDDLLSEIERLMNFYRFSLHQGEKEINHIIMVGDTPYLSKIVNLVNQRYSISVTSIDTNEQINGEQIK